jgi:hypothetical protein
MARSLPLESAGRLHICRVELDWFIAFIPGGGDFHAIASEKPTWSNTPGVRSRRLTRQRAPGITGLPFI